MPRWQMQIMVIATLTTVGCNRPIESVNARASIGAALPAEAFQFKFISPAKEAVIADNQVNIQVAVTGPTEDTDTWSIYYYQNPDKINEALLMVEKLPFSRLTYDWDTTALAPGNYFIFARLNVSDKTTDVLALSDIAIVHAYPNNKLPVVTLQNFNGQEVYSPASAKTILFKAVDADSDALTFKLEYTADGSHFTEITGGTLTAKTGSDYAYTWDTTNATKYPSPNTKYRLRITANDGKQDSVPALSKDFFGFANLADIIVYRGDAANGIQDLLADKCASCHSAVNPQGGFNVLSYDSVRARVSKENSTEARNANLALRIISKDMPRSPQPTLSDNDMQKIVLFAWCGAPFDSSSSAKCPSIGP